MHGNYRVRADRTSRTLFLLYDVGFHDWVGNIKLNVVFQHKVSPP